MASSESHFVEFNAARRQDPHIITHLTTNDILMGRGAPLTYYEGNIKFRELVRPRKAEYVSSKNQHKKQQIAMQLYVDVERRGGRFLQKVSPADAALLGAPMGGNAWYMVSQNVALEKIKQALREKTVSDESPPTTTVSSQPVRMPSFSSEQPDASIQVPIANQVAQPLLSLQNGNLAPNDFSEIVQHPTIGCEGIRREPSAARSMNEYASLQPNREETMLQSPANVANLYRNGPTNQTDFSSLALLAMLRQHGNTQNQTGPAAIGHDQGGSSFDSAVLQLAQNAASVHERNEIMQQQLAQPIHQPSLADRWLLQQRQQQQPIQRRHLLDLYIQQQLQVTPMSIAATIPVHPVYPVSRVGLPGSLPPSPQASSSQILNQLLDQRARSILQFQDRSNMPLTAPLPIPAAAIHLNATSHVANPSLGAITNTALAVDGNPTLYTTNPSPNATATESTRAVTAGTELTAATPNLRPAPLAAAFRDPVAGSAPTDVTDEVASIAATATATAAATAAISGATEWTPRTDPNHAAYWRDPAMVGLVATPIPPPTNNNEAGTDEPRASKRARL